MVMFWAKWKVLLPVIKRLYALLQCAALVTMTGYTRLPMLCGIDGQNDIVFMHPQF